METKVIFYGIFFEQEDIIEIAEKLFPKARLQYLAGNPHVTFAFKKEMTEGFKKLLGKEAGVIVSGYGNNGKNEGFAVTLLDNKKEFLGKIPHITISVADGEKAVNTANLKFQALPFKRLVLKGKYGYFGSDGKVHFE